MMEEKQKILFVGNLFEYSQIIESSLGEEYQVFFIDSGNEAIREAASLLPDMIFLNFLLSDYDGYKVCSQLKNNEITQKIPVIIISDKDEDSIIETRGLQAGAIDFITLPIRPEILKTRIKNHLDLKKYRDYLEDFLKTDNLTGIANRRRFDEFFHWEWRRAARDQTPLSLIILTVDSDKNSMDNYNHLMEEDRLRSIAKTLSNSIKRGTDLVARYGGEEFVCLLPNTDIDGANEVAKKIQEKIEELKIQHTDPSVKKSGTMSFGISTLIPSPGQIETDLIQQARDNLEEAKRNNASMTRSL